MQSDNTIDIIPLIKIICIVIDRGVNMQLHSSVIPVGLPSGLLAGWLTFHTVSSMGAMPDHALSIAAWAGTAIDLLAGGAKNLILIDILSLITVRPISALTTFWGVVALFAKSAT